jgi:hypothetical protein
VNTHTYVHMKNEEYGYPRIRNDSASFVSNARVAYLSMTEVYALGGKDKNKVSKEKRTTLARM